MAETARPSVPLPIDDYLASLHARFAELRTGAVATYIPELAKADPGWFGICIATTDGRVYEVGDTRQPFTIQSISKPFVYGLALEDRGREAVLAQDRRRADRRRLQLDQPRVRHRPAVEPDDQRRRDRRGLAGRRTLERGPVLPRALDVLAVCRARARPRSGGVRVRARHRPPQPRDRPHAAQLRHRHRGSQRSARRVLPAVLDRGRLPRPGGDGRDARQRRRQPARPASARSAPSACRTSSA